MLSLRILLIRLFAILLILCYSAPGNSQGSQIDTSGYLPSYYSDHLEYNLLIAAQKGYPSEIERLINKGADVNTSTYEGATPLIIAVSNRHADAVSAILSFEPETDAETYNSETALLIAVKTFNTPVAEMLIRAGADIDKTDQSGASPLHYAAIYGAYQMADMLLYYFASPDNKSNDGTTPLMAAVWSGFPDIVSLLMSKGANLEARDNEGFTPFLIAAQNGDTLIMDMFLEKGVDIYEKNYYNYDALGLAVRSDASAAVEYLAGKGIRWTQGGNEAVNPYEVARKYNRNDIFELLEQSGISGIGGHRIDQMAVTLSPRISQNDLYAGLRLSFREPLLDGGIIAGLDTKPWYSAIMIDSGDDIIYQYREKRTLVYAGLFKDFTVLRSNRAGIFSLNTTLLAGVSFGNKLKGTLLTPENKFVLVPEAGIRWTLNDLSFFAGVDYIKSSYYKYSQLWIRTGVSFSFFFDKVKGPAKTIKWF
jgi:ankyrin repeat protein